MFGLRMLLSFCLIICQFQAGVPYKRVGYKTVVYLPTLYVRILTMSFTSSLFRAYLESPVVTYKKDLKENYKPVSILPILSKVFERTMFAQISNFFENFLSTQQRGFPKCYNMQHCLLALSEK